MVTVLHMRSVVGMNKERADALAKSLVGELAYRSTKLECPNEHDQKDHPRATITVQTHDEIECKISHNNMCCEDYYKLLIDLSVHVPPPDEKEAGAR